MQSIGVILAGGKSTRMGKDKAAIRHKGMTLLDHARNTLKSAGIITITVLGRDCEPDGIADDIPHAGPAVNLAHWINKQTLPVRLTIVPVDMPLLTTEIIQHLVEIPEGAYFEDMYVPFSAYIRKPISSPPNKLKTLVKILGLKTVTPLPKWENKLKNINQPTDLGLLNPSN